jgi:hypothetical protein
VYIQKYIFKNLYNRYTTSREFSSEVLCASVLVKSGLENRDYGRRGSAALIMRHPSIDKS